MTPATPGIHHVSAIAGDPGANATFYAETLGLRPVKRTVNFEDIFTYHLYYGNELAEPGTVLTSFAYPRDDPGRVGKPQPSAVALEVPAGAVDYWHDRLESRGVAVDGRTDRFDETVLSVRDPDGLQLELVATATPDEPVGGRESTVPSEYAIRGIRGVTLLSASVFHTASTLEVLGYELTGQEGDRVRYRAPGGRAAVVDLLDVDAAYGREGRGTIHHVAVRAGETPLPEWRERLVEAGADPSRIKDRYYFESLYVREPGGILFEIATEKPGLTVDEDPEELGSALRLPPWLEEDREMIEGQLPPLEFPGG